VVEPGDIVTAFNGTAFADVDELRAAVAKNGVDDAAELTVIRDGATKTLEVTPRLSDGDEPAPVIGVTLATSYDFPVDVSIQLDNVGGPSAGQMFALGIIDKLTPGSLTGGAHIAGTGTIDAEGEVGPIGGIRQKLYGAKDAGAEYFLAPESNCNEVTGHIPRGLEVFAVGTLDDSLAVLAGISAGADLSALPTCPAE
jgi:PDZ domain-containing protein